jgi:hypothetical protein
MNTDRFGAPRNPAPFEPQPSRHSPRRRSPWPVVLGLLVAAALAGGGYALFAKHDGVGAAGGSALGAAPNPSPHSPAQSPSELPYAITAHATATATALPATQDMAPPTDGGAPASSCPSAADAEIPAFIFVGALALEQPQDAQNCVYPGTVDPATTVSLSGRAFEKKADDHSDTGAAATFTFTEVGGHGKLEVTTTKEADGKYYVTAVGLR